MHSHSASRREEGGRRLFVALLLNLVIMFVEIIGGVMSGSLALLTDAAHMFVDVVALSIGCIAIAVSRRPPDAKRTYGYRRAEILAAVANGVLLLVLLVVLVWRAIARLSNPQPIAAEVMTAVAFLGLLANVGSLLILRAHRHTTHNLRAAFLHVLSDTLSSVAVVVAGIVIARTGMTILDPLASFCIAGLIIRQVWKLLREAVGILLEGTPAHLSLEEVRQAMCSVEGVRGIHDLHITTHASNVYVFTAHVLLDAGQPLSAALGIIAAIRKILSDRFRIRHATMEIDTPDTCTKAHEHCVCEFPPVP